MLGNSPRPVWEIPHNLCTQRSIEYMLTSKILATAVDRALAEDAPWGDATVAASIPADMQFTAHLVAREPGVFAGGAVWLETFGIVDAGIMIAVLVADCTAVLSHD